MQRILLLAVASCLTASASLAQTAERSRPRPIEARVRDGGTYHLAQGSWTRVPSSPAAAAGFDVIYDNTCSSGYFVGVVSGETITDEGRLPGPATPDTATTKPGCAPAYLVGGFEIAYCTTQASTTIGVSFVESYVPCSAPAGLPTAASFQLTGLPATPSVGTQACWLIGIDLASSDSSFAIASDGGTGGGPPTFGYSLSMSNASSATDGFFIAGDPAMCSPWDGTIWDPVVDLSEEGTGMGNLDQLRFDGGPASGCFFFGGSPFAGLHMEMYADRACAPAPGTDFCAGNGSGTACPCGNDAPASRPYGCVNSFGQGGSLDSLGVASVASDTLVLRASNLPSSTAALFSQATGQANGGAGTVVADGLGCLAGSTVRLATLLGENGAAFLPQPGAPRISVLGAIPGGGGVTRHYQVTYRDNASFCTAAQVNLTNGHTIVWAP